MIRLAPAFTILVMLGPVAAGIAGTVLPALGWLPALGGRQLSLDAVSALAGMPGLWRSTALSFAVGLGSTFVAFVLVIGFVAATQGTAMLRLATRLISPLLSVPHVTLAIGIAFLIAPSGWIVRLVSPWLSGWERPPDILVINDPLALSLAGALILKEAPFLFLMLLAALDRIPADRILMLAQSMGYRSMTAWLKGVFPQLYPRMRLPIFAVLAFSTSTVDMAIVLGPSTPAPLSVRVVQWMNDPDLAFRFVGSAGALLQALVTFAAVATWLAGERVVRWLGRRWITAGGRGGGEGPVRLTLAVVMSAALTFSVGAMAVLVIWSVAGPWRFPDALPAALSLAGWQQGGDGLLTAVLTTGMVAVASATVALILAVACLENEIRRGRRPRAGVDWLLYTPLLVPQVAFLFGIQVLLVTTRLDGSLAAVAWSHLVFVLPYVFLSLAGPWRRFDRRYVMVGRTLGKSPTDVLLRVTLPMLIRPILTAWAVGIAVSVALYLPTLFAGAGRITTLTTEAVALASSGDRRISAAVGLLQIALPLAAFTLAHMLPGRLSQRPHHPAPAAA